MTHLPVILKSDRQNALVAGDDLNTLAKVRLLLESGVRVTVIAPGAGDILKRANLLGDDFAQGRLQFENRTVEAADLDDRTLFYVVGQEFDEQKRLLALGQEARVATTIVDAPKGSDFISPAVATRGPVAVSFSTGGEAPVFARRLRADIERLLPQNLGPLVKAAGNLRDRIKELIGNATVRRQFWDALYDAADNPDFSVPDQKALEARVLNFARDFLASESEEGLIQLVGAGPGDPELLTIKAHRALQQADLVVYDKLVSEEILSLGRRDAEFIYVGKTMGNHGIGQDGINELLVTEALKGRRVVRLKAGDPMVFGRAGEEIDAARAAGITIEVVPGITALSGISSATQIPLTHRDHAQAVTLVTGHLKDDTAQEFAGLAGEGRTLAVYMGLTSAAEIQSNLMGKGLPGDLPVAIVENGTRKDERRFYGTLSELASIVAAHQIKSPGLIIIGKTAALSVDLVAREAERLTA